MILQTTEIERSVMLVATGATGDENAGIRKLFPVQSPISCIIGGALEPHHPFRKHQIAVRRANGARRLSHGYTKTFTAPIKG